MEITLKPLETAILV